MVISGTHGSKDGVSGLTDIARTNLREGHEFYREDCAMFGIQPGPFRSRQRPPLSVGEPFTEEDWLRFPDITRPAERINPSQSPGPERTEEWIEKMDIRVAYTTYYYKNEDKLIKDIKEVR